MRSVGGGVWGEERGEEIETVVLRHYVLPCVLPLPVKPPDNGMAVIDLSWKDVGKFVRQQSSQGCPRLPVHQGIQPLKEGVVVGHNIRHDNEEPVVALLLLRRVWGGGGGGRERGILMFYQTTRC